MTFTSKKAASLNLEEYIEYFNGGEWLWGKVLEKFIYHESDSNDVKTELVELTIESGDNITLNGDYEVLSSDVEPVGVKNRPAIPTWEEYFMSMAKTVATRAKCRRRMVGAILVDEENRVIGTGYNGFPKAGGNDNSDCLTGACPRGLLSNEELKAYSSYDAGPGLCISSHAEVQAIAYRLKDSNNSRIYVTDKPCFSCTKVLYSHGVVEAHWFGEDSEVEKAFIEDIFNEYLNAHKML